MNPWRNTTGGGASPASESESGRVGIPLSSTRNEYAPERVRTSCHDSTPHPAEDAPPTFAVSLETTRSRGRAPRSTPTPPPGRDARGAAGGIVASPSSHAPVPKPWRIARRLARGDRSLSSSSQNDDSVRPSSPFDPTEGSKVPRSMEFIRRMRASRDARNGTASSSPSFASIPIRSARALASSSALAAAAASTAAASIAAARFAHVATPTPDSNAVVTTTLTPRDLAAAAHAAVASNPPNTEGFSTNAATPNVGSKYSASARSMAVPAAFAETAHSSTVSSSATGTPVVQ
mmetsp:Transcript_7871/g.31166  ORF Transcript_7871/g.31166 Transcript_7871/m.31166 type:complete len:291 (-) Transcript_7871:2688-3560(-)